MNEIEIIKGQEKIIYSITFFVISLLIIFMGMSGNFIAIQNNNGKMPIFSTYSYSIDTHFTYQDQSEINNSFFTDRFNINGEVSSIGDIFLFIGILFIILSLGFTIRYIRRVRRLKSELKF